MSIMTPSGPLDFRANNSIMILAEWEHAVTAWRSFLIAGAAPKTTIDLRIYQVTRLATAMIVGPSAVTADDLIEWLSTRPWSRETRRSYRSGLRSFFKWAHRTGRIPFDPSIEIPSIAARPPDPRPAPLDACLHALAGAPAREGLMVRLAAELGLRRGEVARVRSDDVERDLIGYTLRVLGKGAKVRRVPIPDDLAREIVRLGPGFTFPGHDEGHLSPRWVGKLVSRRLPGAWTMHSLRHRFATAAYAHDRDVLTVQQLLGHASPVTTRAYVQVPDTSLRAAVGAARLTA